MACTACNQRITRWMYRAAVWVHGVLCNKKRTKKMRKYCGQLPFRYFLARFLRDGVAILCIIVPLYDRTIYTLPYVILPFIYVQLWVHRRSAKANRRVDKAVAYMAMIDLFITYLSVTDTVGEPFRNMTESINSSPWFETNLPKWDYTSSALRMCIVAGFSALSLLPLAQVKDIVKELDSDKVSDNKSLPSQVLQRSERFFLRRIGEEDQAVAFLGWLLGALYISGYVLCLVLWSVIAITPTSPFTLVMAWICTVQKVSLSTDPAKKSDKDSFFRRTFSWQLAALQIFVLMHWCVGCGGVVIPGVESIFMDSWRAEAESQVTMGVVAVVLLSLWRVHDTRSNKVAWEPHPRTLHKLHTFRVVSRSFVINVLVICGLGKASVIHVVYFLCGRIFLMFGNLHYRGWLSLGTFAYVAVIAGLVWNLLFPPIYRHGHCDELLALPDTNCTVRLDTIASYLPNITAGDECPVHCASAIADATEQSQIEMKEQDSWQAVGVHACTKAADCQFNSFGWSTVVALAVTLQIGVCNFSHDHKQRLKEHTDKHADEEGLTQEEIEDKKRYDEDHAIWMASLRRRFYRSVSSFVIIWAFVVTHATDRPKVFLAWIFSFVMVFWVAYLGVSHRLNAGKRSWHRFILLGLWIIVFVIISLSSLLEYSYTLDFVSTFMDSRFGEHLWLNQTLQNVTADDNTTSVRWERHGGIVTEGELGLQKTRTIAEQVVFFLLVVNSIFAYLGVKNFEEAHHRDWEQGEEDEGRRAKAGKIRRKKTARSRRQMSRGKTQALLEDRLGPTMEKLRSCRDFMVKAAKLYAPKIVLIVAYYASQVEPLRIIFAVYLLPVAAMLIFGQRSYTVVWHWLAWQAAVSWIITYTWQFEFCKSFEVNEIWGLTRLPHMWDRHLLVHVWVLLAVAFYRAVCTDSKDPHEQLARKPLFEAAWPHLSERFFRKDSSLRWKFIASHFLLGFGETIFFSVCLFSATLRRDNFSILYVLNLMVFFAGDRKKIRKGMRINFAVLVFVQTCVCAAAITDKIYQKFGQEIEGTGGFEGFLVNLLRAFLYFSQNSNDDSSVESEESLNASSFWMLFVMSSILRNIEAARKMVKHKNEEALEEVHKRKTNGGIDHPWPVEDLASSGSVDYKREEIRDLQLLDTIERLCFIDNIPLKRQFQHLEKQEVNDEWVDACTPDEFAKAVMYRHGQPSALTPMGEALKSYEADEERMLELLRDLARKDPENNPWICQNDGGAQQEELVLWVDFANIVSADIQDRMLSWTSTDEDEMTKDLLSQTLVPKQKMRRLFERFAKFDSKEREVLLDWKGHREMQDKVARGKLTAEELVTEEEYEELCNKLDPAADAKKGIDQDAFERSYEGETGLDLGADIDEEFAAVFDAEPSKKRRFLNMLWTGVLMIAVDCMALVIGFICLSYESSFSLVMCGYLLFAMTFLRDQRSERDSEKLRALHKYTFLHILLQSVFLFVDPLLEITAPTTALSDSDAVTELNATYNVGEVLTRLVGLEAKDHASPTSVYALAAGLFAWIIVVSELQKSKAYSALRLNVREEQSRAKARHFLSFATQLLDRQRALSRIETTLEGIDRTQKRITSRRGDITAWLDQEARAHWDKVRIHVRTRRMFQQRGPKLNLLAIETRNLREVSGADARIKCEVQMCASDTSEPPLQPETTEVVPVGRESTQFKTPDLFSPWQWRPNNVRQTLRVKVMRDDDSAVGAVSIENLDQLGDEVVDEWYQLHHPSSQYSLSRGQVRLKFRLMNWGDKNADETVAKQHEASVSEALGTFWETAESTHQLQKCSIHIDNIPLELTDEKELQVFVTQSLASKLDEDGDAKVDHFVVQTTVRVREGASWALMTFSAEQVVEDALEHHGFVTATGTKLQIQSVDDEKAGASEGEFGKVWGQVVTNAQKEISKRIKAGGHHPDLKGWRKRKKDRIDEDLNVQGLFSEMGSLLQLHRFSPRRLAVRALLAQKKHLGMSAGQAAAELAGSSTSDHVAIFAQHVFITQSQRACYLMIFLNQWVNHNLFSVLYFCALVGVAMCEHPHVPSGFWAVLIIFVQIEIAARYILSIPYLGVQDACAEYQSVVRTNPEFESPYPFTCQSVDPTDRIDILLLLFVVVMFHEFRMKRQGVWDSWDNYIKEAEALYGDNIDRLEDARQGVTAAMRRSVATNSGSDDNDEDSDVLDGGDAEKSMVHTLSTPLQQLPEEDEVDIDGEDDDKTFMGVLGLDEEQGGSAEPLVEAEEEASVFQQAAVALLAGYVRLKTFCISFHTNVLEQDEKLEDEEILSIVDGFKQMRAKAAEKSTAPVKELDALGPQSRNRSATSMLPMSTPTGSTPISEQPMAALFRRSSYKFSKDLYTPSLVCELLSLLMCVLGFDENLSSDALSDVSTGYIDSELIWMSLLQFVFIVADCAANMKQSIPLKFTVQWVSLLTYLPIFYLVHDDFNTALGMLFVLKTAYWMLGCMQIRYGYPHDTASSSTGFLMLNETHRVRHYSSLLLHALPFVVEIRTALRWIFNATTMRYEDCVKFDEIMSMMFLIRCKFARDDELNRAVGKPQKPLTKLGMGSFLLLQFFVYLWGPLIVVTFMDDVLDLQLNNVRSASIRFDLQIGGTPIPVFETRYSTVSGWGPAMTEHVPEFVLSGYPDNTVSDQFAPSTLCKELFEPAMEAFDPHHNYNTKCDGSVFVSYSQDMFDSVQVVQFGEYSDQTWSPSSQRLRTSQTALNDSNVAVTYSLQVSFETPNNTVVPTKVERGRLGGSDWERSTMCTGMSPQCSSGGACTLSDAWNLTEGGTNRDVLQLMFDSSPTLLEPPPAQSTLCVPAGESAYSPALYLSREAEASPKLLDPSISKATACLCMVTDMAVDRRVWQLLQGYGPDHRMPNDLETRSSRPGASVGPGVSILTVSQKVPTGVAQTVASIGLVGLYVTFVMNMARGLKLTRERLVRNLVYEDRYAADFIHKLCIDLLQVRKLAKLQPPNPPPSENYFYLEERLWYKLQFLFRDSAELLEITEKDKQAHFEKKKRQAEADDSSSDDDSSDDDDGDDGDDDDDDDGKKGDSSPSGSAVSNAAAAVLEAGGDVADSIEARLTR